MHELVFASQINRWQQILDIFNLKDIYFARDYLISALKLDPGEVMLFYYIDEAEHGEIIYPFIKRQLEKDDRAYYDITSPFGYGGPVLKIKNDAEKLASNFMESFSNFCNEEKILAEYIRFHPHLNNSSHFRSKLKLIPVYETYTIQLDSYLNDENKNGLEKGVHERGFSFRKLGTVEHMFDFLVLYYSTIRHSEEKSSYYFFTNDYFETLVSSLGPDLQLFGIYKENKLIAATYVLVKGDTIYQHLSGNIGSEIHIEAEIELLNHIAEWGASNGFRYFHIADRKLTAGNLPGNTQEVLTSTYFIAMRIHDPEKYKSCHPLKESELKNRYGNV